MTWFLYYFSNIILLYEYIIVTTAILLVIKKIIYINYKRYKDSFSLRLRNLIEKFKNVLWKVPTRSDSLSIKLFTLKRLFNSFY